MKVHVVICAVLFTVIGVLLGCVGGGMLGLRDRAVADEAAVARRIDAVSSTASEAASTASAMRSTADYAAATANSIADATHLLNKRVTADENVLAKLITAAPHQMLQDISVRVEADHGCGTGVLVTRQLGNVKRTFVWTAGHVAQLLMQPNGTFKSATIYQERRVDGRWVGEVRTEAKVLAYSDPEVGDDLALLEVLKDNFTDASAEFDDSGKPSPIGTELVHVGCTLGLYDSVSYGIISQTDRDLLNTGKVFDQTSCMGYPGSSGGGVYLKNGKCIGLLVRGAGAGLNFIAPTRRMWDWAVKYKLEWAIDPSRPVIMPHKAIVDGPAAVPCALQQLIDSVIRATHRAPATKTL
jgi:S1-C subfamily serine protease